MTPKAKHQRVPSATLTADPKAQIDLKAADSVPVVGSKPAAQLNGLLRHNDQTMAASALRKVVVHHAQTTAVVHRSVVAMQAQAAAVGSSAPAQAAAARQHVAAATPAVVHREVVVPVAVSNNAPVVGRNVPAAGRNVRAVLVAIGVPAVVRKMGKTGTVRLVIVAGRQAHSAMQRHKRCVRRYVRAARLSCRR